MQVFVFWARLDGFRLFPGTVLMTRRLGVHLVSAIFSIWHTVKIPGTLGQRVFACICCVEPLHDVVELNGLVCYQLEKTLLIRDLCRDER